MLGWRKRGPHRRQQRLDIAYPALLAATLVMAILLLSPAGLGRWRWLLAATALPGMVFDYLENASVAAMLDGKRLPRESYDAIVSSGDIALSHVDAEGYRALHRIGGIGGGQTDLTGQRFTRLPF